MIYAIGDIHGELPLLEELLGEIRQDAHRQSGDTHKIIFIGDYVDRGLHSREVIDLVMGGVDGFETICLRGNHEQMFLDFLEDPSLERAESWNRDFVGGRETLASYGIDLNEIVSVLSDGGEVNGLLEPVHDTHIDWMNTLPLEHHEPKHMFVHAGIMPGVSLEAQQDQHLLWIRETFLESQRDHGKVIVHGHSSRRTAELLPNRINIDTGACLFGILTAVALDGTTPKLMQVRGERTAPFPSKELMAQRERERREAQ